MPWLPNCTAAEGISTACGSISARRRIFTNWLGKRISSSLAKRAFSLRVPVVVSIWLSRLCSTPSACLILSPRSQASTTRGWPARKRPTTSGNWPSGRVKATLMGRVWVMTTSGVVSPLLTRLPWSTWRRPRRPPMGARTWVKPRLSLASATAASSVLRVPRYCATRASWVSRVCLAMLSSA
ncbi:hypothetical protein D3C84_893770 [compost metagenome]